MNTSLGNIASNTTAGTTPMPAINTTDIPTNVAITTTTTTPAFVMTGTNIKEDPAMVTLYTCVGVILLMLLIMGIVYIYLERKRFTGRRYAPAALTWVVGTPPASPGTVRATTTTTAAAAATPAAPYPSGHGVARII